eukprot:TRINITY_DN6102_c0_g1_i2.p1 TRINITY_DN6102_c0_g1~~TRINITY_DN6102_c0_g1_i2.p1  ORF type:complete len:483 (+),score=104.42 TRINITY_DN6102_c0_g1_i2:193-1641(+)
MEALDEFLAPAAANVALPLDQLKYLICLMSCYPLAFGLRFMLIHKVPSALVHLFSIVLSLTFTLFSLGPWAIVHFVAQSGGVYLLLLALPRNLGYKFAYGFAMGYLTLSHIYRMYDDYMGWSLDFTGPLMIITIKLTEVAINYYDGSRNEEDLSENERKSALKQLPTLLEYYGYVFFFGGFLAGPALEYYVYRDYVNGSLFEEYEKKGLRPKGGPHIPPTTMATLTTFARALVAMPIMLIPNVLVPLTYLVSDHFLDSPMYMKIAVIIVLPVVFRARYYFAWYVAEGACTACGISFLRVDSDNTINWTRCRNAWPLKVEWPTTMRDTANEWNLGVAHWLKHYVYLRLTPKGQRPTTFNTVVTYLVSAFWHGFYPGYYMFFVSCGLMQEMARDWRRAVRPYFVGPDGKPFNTTHKFLYDQFTRVISMLCIEYIGAAFMLLSFERGLIVYRTFYWIPHIGCVIGLIFFRVILPMMKPARKPKTA